MAAAEDDAAADALLSKTDARPEEFGRALLDEIVRLRNKNESREKILNVAVRFLRYSNQPAHRAWRTSARHALGVAYANLERWSLAEKELVTAVALYRRDGSSTSQHLAWIYLELANVNSQSGSLARARSHYETLLPIAGSIDDKESITSAYNGLATLSYRLGDFSQAYRYLDQSLAAANAIRDEKVRMATLARLGFVFSNQGRVGKSVEAYEAAYRTAVGLGSPTSVNYLFESALAHVKLGDLSSAYSRFRRVQAETAANPDRRLFLYCLLNIAWIHKLHGQEGKATSLYQRAVDLADHEISNGNVNLRTLYISAKADAVNRLAEIYAERGVNQGALDLYTRNLKMLQSLAASGESGTRSSPRSADATTIAEIGINASLGSLHSSLGNNTEASAYFSAALELAEAVGFERGLIETLLSMATHAARRGDPQTAFSYVNRVEQLTKKNGRLDQLLKLRTITAGVHRKLNRPSAADLMYQEAIRVSEALRTDILVPAQRASYFSSLFAPFDEYIDFLMERHVKEPDAGFDGKAFNVSERRRARALLDSLKVARADIRQGVEPTLLEQESRLRNQLNSAAREQSSTVGFQFTFDDDPLTTPATTAKSDIDRLTAELAGVEAAIRKQSPRYAELMQPRPLRWGGVQTLLDDKTVLLNYTLGTRRSYLWAITREGIKSYELPPRSAIEDLVKRVYSDVSENPHEGGTIASSSQAITELSRLLLQPAAETFGSKRIVVVADGALQYLPFSILPDPRSSGRSEVPILASNEIQFAPSASVVAVLRQEAERRPEPPRSVAVFADPVFSADDERFETVEQKGRPAATRAVESWTSRDLFIPRLMAGANASDLLNIPRLPFSRREAEAIFSNAPAGTSFRALDFEASRKSISSLDLSKYGVVHFATHGILDSEYPELSGVVLSLVDEKAEPVDGFLRLNEIYNMKLNADLVVLSACQTALGKEVRGEGLIGLTRGFMYAGSPRVLASLWKVDDVATAELMKIFYQKLLRENMRPASALRAAKVEMMMQKRWSAPYFWAAFELQGEWR